MMISNTLKMPLHLFGSFNFPHVSIIHDNPIFSSL
jgi:hypothetical protein